MDPDNNTPNFKAAFFAEYFPERELARVLGVSPRTLRRWNERRCGPPRTVIGRKVYYKKDSAMRWIGRSS
jgi:Helix-turn-helix domain